MRLEPHLVQAIYGISWITSTYLGYVVWRHREKTGAVPLFVAIIGAWVWSFTLFVNTFVTDLTASRYLLGSNYVGVVIAVAGIFLFSLAYTGRSHLINRRTIGVLAIEPAIVVPLALFNPGNIFFASITLDPTRAVGIMSEFGPAFYLHTAYSYVVVFVASALIVGLVYRTRAMYRGQLVVLVSAVLVPLIPNALAISRTLNFDATPLGFLVANSLYTVAITRYRLIDLAPIARDRVVNNLNDAVFVVDTGHRIVDVNPAGVAMAEEFTGRTVLIGSNARDLLSRIPEVASLYDDIVTHGMDRTVEYDIGGGHYLADATQIEDARGHVVGWLFVIRDITGRKRREQQLRERNEQLDKFASVVSHDLRNPLQVASGRVEIARSTGDVEHLSAAEDALERMEAIIDDVLALARSGDTVSDLSPVELSAAAETAWRTVDTGAARLQVEADGRITADHDRLVRLLENLFRNAVEHGPKRARSQAVDAATDGPTEAVGRERTDDRQADATAADPALVVTVALVQEDGRPVGFAVADDGQGIPREKREEIFESGFSTSDEGTGFGLTIVTQIAEAHGWTVTASESESGGAQFEFRDVEVVAN